jgi:hypothetical protein
MRPYFVLCAVILIAVAAFGQQPVPRVYGPCLYGCGPFIPLTTTPMISLEQYSPNPVGARNATTGLVAGATNSTLSEPVVDTSSVYTVPVWYQGGDAPRTTSAIHLSPQPEGHAMHPMRMEMEHRHREAARGAWIFFSGSEHTTDAVTASVAAKSGKKAARTYTNDDVERQNQNNGTVKYDGKTEKL